MSEWLGDQLREILHASAVSRSPRLVPNACGSRLYSASSCWGRLWIWFWSMVRAFDWFGKLRQKALIKVAHKVHRSWEASCNKLSVALSTFDTHFTCHLEALEKQDEGKRVDPAEVERVKSGIPWMRKAAGDLRHFGRTIGRAIDQEGRGTLETKTQQIWTFLHSFLGLKVFVAQQAVRILEQGAMDYALVRLNERVKGVLPYLPLRKIALKIDLEAYEREEYDPFIEKLASVCNRKAEHKRFTIKELHRAFKGIVQRFDPSYATLSHLEWVVSQSLAHYNCKIFSNPDPEHILWAKEHSIIRFGQHRQVVCNGKSYPLGEELKGADLRHEEKHLVFISDEKTVVRVSLENKASLRLEVMRNKASELNLPYAEPILVAGVPAVSDEYAIYERLNGETPNRYRWELDTNLKRFERRRDAFIAILKEMVVNDYTPIGFSPTCMRFTESDSLKFIRPLPKGPFDYSLMMRVIMECISDEVVIGEVVTGCRLNKHERGIFFEKIWQLTIDGKEEALEDVLKHVSDDDYVEVKHVADDARNVKAQIERLTHKWADEIDADYVVHSYDDILDKMIMKLLNLQKISRIYSRIPKIDKELVFNEIFSVYPILLKENIFLRRKDNVIFRLRQNQENASEKIVRKLCYQQGIFHDTQIRLTLRCYRIAQQEANVT